MKTKTTFDKIDEILGISSDMNLDDYLRSLADENNTTKKVLSSIKNTISADLAEIDDTINRTNIKNVQLNIYNLDSSMKKIENLIDLAEDMITHVHDCFCNSDLVDSELLHAASTFIESMHINIAEFISMYRDKQKFIEKVKLMAYAQEQKKELMQMKYDLDMKKMREKEKSEAIDATGNAAGQFSFTVEDVTKALQSIDGGEKTIEEIAGIPEVKIPADDEDDSSESSKDDNIGN